MKFANKITVNVCHLVNGYCENCHAKRLVTNITKADIAKYHGPYCRECGGKLSI